MSQFKMPSAEKKAEFVQENFDLISTKYDLFNDLNSFYLHRVWKNSIVDLIKSKYKNENISALDLCCGTGDISFRLEKLSQITKLYCIDFSDKMISFARERLKESKKSQVEIGDATDLSRFQNNSLDIITIGFGLRNVNDLNKTLKEIYRVLKPNGIFINLDVGKVKNPIIRFFADFYFFKIVPLLGYIIWGGKNSMFDYLPVSSLHYPNQEKLKELMIELKFTEVEYKNFVFGNVALHWGFKN